MVLYFFSFFVIVFVKVKVTVKVFCCDQQKNDCMFQYYCVNLQSETLCPKKAFAYIKNYAQAC